MRLVPAVVACIVFGSAPARADWVVTTIVHHGQPTQQGAGRGATACLASITQVTPEEAGAAIIACTNAPPPGDGRQPETWSPLQWSPSTGWSIRADLVMGTGVGSVHRRADPTAVAAEWTVTPAGWASDSAWGAAAGAAGLCVRRSPAGLTVVSNPPGTPADVARAFLVWRDGRRRPIDVPAVRLGPAFHELPPLMFPLGDDTVLWSGLRGDAVTTTVRGSEVRETSASGFGVVAAACRDADGVDYVLRGGPAGPKSVWTGTSPGRQLATGASQRSSLTCMRHGALLVEFDARRARVLSASAAAPPAPAPGLDLFDAASDYAEDRVWLWSRDSVGYLVVP